MALKHEALSEGALEQQISAFVLHGFATTSTLTCREATWSIADAWPTKIGPDR